MANFRSANRVTFLLPRAADDNFCKHPIRRYAILRCGEAAIPGTLTEKWIGSLIETVRLKVDPIFIIWLGSEQTSTVPLDLYITVISCMPYIWHSTVK